MTGERFTVVDGSETAHCCFEATVVDTTKRTWHDDNNGVQHYDAVCECMDRANAEAIAAALNRAPAYDLQRSNTTASSP